MKDTADILPLALEGVSLRRGNRRVLKDIDCRFDASLAKTLIVGPNGAGKSLLLRVAHGLVAPDAGRVSWRGGAASAREVRAEQAMVFQRPVLLRRSVRANLAFALKGRGLGRTERRSRIDEMLARTGLARFAAAPARALSFGEQQRLALARALIVRPRVLFLDEPTANLDPAAAHLVEELVAESAARGVRIVMTSHDLGQAARLADEVIFLYRGRIKERAPAKRFFERPENDLARAFLRGELLWWRRRRTEAGIDCAPVQSCEPGQEPS